MCIRSVRRIAHLVLLASCAVVLAGCSLFSSPDPRFEPAPLTTYPAGATVSKIWSVSLGSGGGYGFAPVVVGDAVYAAAPSGKVSKIDLSSGRVDWQTATKKGLTAGVGSDGTVTAVAEVDGTVVAFDGNGHETWRARASSEVNIPPTVGEGVVAVRSSDYRIQAFDEATGKPLWDVQRPGPALALKTNMQMILVQGLLISGLPNGHLIAINAHTGSVQWEGPVSISEGATDLERISDVVGTPQVQGSALCGVTYQGHISCFDVAQGGRLMWSQAFSSTTGMTSDAQQLYVSDQRSVVYAFNLADGHQVWKQDALRNRRLSAPAVVHPGVAVGDLDGYVHILSRADGHLLGRIQVGGGAILSPLLATDRGILVQTGNGDLDLVGVN
ncbi:MAG: outer membrane protein assembly factor BamB [Candidimonas sp.]|nr:MAG: outer membrane protein assembly factor BamB [Candidimonas sp.]